MIPLPALRVLRVGVVAAALASGVLVGSPAAHADPLADARAKATALADTVAQLQSQTEAATEKYNLIAGQLAEAAANHSNAIAAADAAQATYAAQQATIAARARALYISGGSLAQWSEVLESGTPRELEDRSIAAQRTSQATKDQIAAAAAAAAASTGALQNASDQAAKVAKLERQANIASGKVSLLLERNQKLLTDANTQVTQIEAQIEADRAAAAAQSFKALLAQARADAGATAVTGTEGDDVPANPTAAAALAAIATKNGVPYQWGGTGPSAYDCSGLTGWAYFQAGIRLPRTAAQQYLAGPHPDLSDLRAGDLLFWATDVSDPATIHHVAMYAGNGLMWSTNHTGDVARLQEIWGADEFIGATRPTADMASAVSPPFWSGS